MKSRSGTLVLLLALLTGLSLFVSQAMAAEPIARVTRSEGKIFIMTASPVALVKDVKAGQTLGVGDRVQTFEGEVDITFNDGALLTVKPWTTVMIHEWKKKEGLAARAGKLIRNISLMVGALLFDSRGAKKDTSFVTPTAVAGIRGTELGIGFDSRAGTTLLKMTAGQVKTKGEVFRQVVFDSTGNNAQASGCFDGFEEAALQFEQAERTGAPLDKARALELGLMANRKCIKILLENNNLPDSLRNNYNEELKKIEADLEKIQGKVDNLMKLKDQKENTEKETERREVSPGS